MCVKSQAERPRSDWEVYESAPEFPETDSNREPPGARHNETIGKERNRTGHIQNRVDERSTVERSHELVRAETFPRPEAMMMQAIRTSFEFCKQVKEGVCVSEEKNRFPSAKILHIIVAHSSVHASRYALILRLETPLPPPSSAASAAFSAGGADGQWKSKRGFGGAG